MFDDAIAKLKAGWLVAVADIHDRPDARVFTQSLLASGHAGVFFIEWVKNARAGNGMIAQTVTTEFGVWLDQACEAMSLKGTSAADVVRILDKGGFFVDRAFDSATQAYDPRRMAPQAGNQAKPTMAELVATAVAKKVIIRPADASYWDAAAAVGEVNVGYKPGIEWRDQIAAMNLRNMLRTQKVMANMKEGRGAILLLGRNHFMYQPGLLGLLNTPTMLINAKLYDLYT